MKIRPISLGAKRNFSMLINKQYLMNEIRRHRYLTREMMQNSEHLDLFISDIFRILNIINKAEDILKHLFTMQDLLLEMRDLVKYCHPKSYFEEKSLLKYQELESNYSYWMDELRIRGFKFVLEMSNYHHSTHA